MENNIKNIPEHDIQSGSNNEADTSQWANDSSEEDESFRTCDNVETGIVVNGPPELSDDSDGSDSEISSEMFLTDDNNDYDTDISNPGREISREEEEDERNVETSFQRELLDYLGSLFNVSSRRRTMDVRQPVTVNDEQLEEYKILQEKVDKEMKILGVAAMKDTCSSDQSIARNLYYLLSARERGDWSSCRQYMRVIPMWSFEIRNASEEDESCGDGASINSSCNKSEGSTKMEVEEEILYVTPASNKIYKDSGGGVEGENEVLEVEEIDFEDRGIAEVTNITESGYLDRGAQLWTEDTDNDVEALKGIVSCKDNISIPVDSEKNLNERLHKEVLCTLNTTIESFLTEKVQKEKMESGVFKRSFQNDNSDEIKTKDGYTRDYFKSDNDRFKKCKLDTNDNCVNIKKCSKFSQVSRIGQRDIKTAIYGSRWSVQRLGLETRFPVHQGCVNALNFSSTGDWLASGSDDREVVITDWQKNKQVSRFSVGHSSNIFQVRFVPGSNDLELVTCSRDRSVRYAALSSTGQYQYNRLLTKHNDACHKMDMPLDQPCLVISAGEDCRVLWSDVRGPKNSGQLCLVDKVPLYSISCNPVRSQEFCVAGKDNRVYIYDRRKPKKALNKLCPEELDEKPRSGYHVTSVVYSGDGNSVLASYNDEDIYLLSVRPYQTGGRITEHKYVGHRNVQTVTGVAFYGPNQDYVVSGSNDGHVLLWERDSEALINWFLADEAGVVNVLQPHPSMPILATSGLDHDIKLWSMLAADRGSPRVITVDDDLIDRDQESSRIDLAWKKLSERSGCPLMSQTTDTGPARVPFNIRNLQVITALNWKMRAESYPYSFDNTLENLIFMSRRQGENQLRNLFISDSDSNESYETVPNILDDSANVGANTGNGSAMRVPSGTVAPDDNSETREQVRDGEESSPGTDRGSNRPDGCRSS